MAQLTQATPRNYWISPNALFIQLNAMGTPDYIQASCASGAQILVYVKDIIPYDAGHNYQRWPLQASPTFFNSHTEKYVYVAVPRSDSSQKEAVVVFPSVEIDIYGKNEKGEQIGNEKYYYIFLQGIITSSGDNGTTPRDWKENCRIVTGYLSSDEAISAGPNDSEWFSFSTVDNVTTFLKDLTMKAGTKFRELFAKAVTIVSGGSITFEGQHTSLSGVADENTAVEAVDRIVTPKYMDDHALSSVHDDVANGLITFLKGLTVGKDGKYHIGADGAALLKSLIADAVNSADYDNTTETGFRLGPRNDGKYRLDITDLLVWGKAIFHNLEIRNLYSVGGAIDLSPSASRIVRVEEVFGEETGEMVGWKCYLLADDGTMATTNQWMVDDQARCQTFNIAEGVYQNVSNKNYWRRVTQVSKTNEQITDENGNVLYDGKKFAWIVLSKTDCMEGSDVPSADDVIVCRGNRTMTDRQHIIVMETVGEKAPSVTLYHGVNGYTLTNKSIFSLSLAGVRATSEFFEFISSDGDKIWIANYLGYWSETKQYKYYDEVSWMGTRWLCIVPEGSLSTEEPSEESDQWRATTNIFKPQLVLTTDLLQTGIARGETHTVVCTLMLGDKDVTSSVTAWKVERKTADAVADRAWAAKDKVKNFSGSLTIVWADDNSEDDLGDGDTASFTFTATTTSGAVHKTYIDI